jgi:RepB DNA-primase from phage plasmid
VTSAKKNIANMRGSSRAQPKGIAARVMPSGHRWASSLPQVAGEDVIDIGEGRYAHFRRDRRFAQVQVMFTAPDGMDPNPGRELTDQFKVLGWTWKPNEPGKPWTYQLDQSSPDNPTARGDSRAALHEQFLLIVEEYRNKYGLPLLSRPSGSNGDATAPDDDPHDLAGSSVVDQASELWASQKPKSEDGETRAGEQVPAMLDAFASVGAERFDLTLTAAAGGKVAFRGNRSLAELHPALSAILQDAAERRHNVIVRPRSAGSTLVQLDDLGEGAAAWLRPVSFLILRTSPSNFQAWVAVADADAGFARRLRQGVGADLTASGATRVSGSMNFKDKYAPDFPRVETVHISPGLVVTRAELEALGTVAPPEITPSV